MGLSSENARMDLNESAERLNAQVEAIKVLSTVRQMQDEIQDINEQIEQENKKLNTNSVGGSSSMESEIEQLESEMQLFSSQTMLTAEDSNDDLSDALRLLAAKQKLQNTQKLIAEAQLRKAESALQQQQQLEREKESFISQIEATKRKEVDRRKLQVRAKMRAAFLDRIKKKKAQDAHKNLFAASNQRVITRLEDMKNRRQKIAELKKKRVVQQQLSKVNAVRLLQQKKLSNLRKGQQNQSPSIASTAALLRATQTSSALTKLSPNEKLQMLSWLDLERNSEILASTDRKIKEKMKAKLTSDKLVRQAARQIVDDYDDYYDDLTDEEIDEILLTIAGGDATSVEDDYYDDFIDEYVDDVDLLDILGDYDVEPIRPAAPVAPVAPIVPAIPQATPAPLLPQAQPFIGHSPAVGVFTPTASPASPFFPFGGAGGPTSPAGPVYHPHTTPTPYHHSVTPSGYHAPVTSSYGAPLGPVQSSYGPPPTPPSYHHDNHHYNDYHRKPSYHDEPHKTTVTHLHFPAKLKKPYHPTPAPTPPAKIEIHHHHSTPRPEPLYKEEHYYNTKITPKPYFTTRPPRRPHHYDPLPPGPPYSHHGYDDDYDYEYYDSYDPPAHFEPHKIRSHYIHPTTPAPYKYSTPSPKPYINTYSTPVTPKPFHDHTTTLQPYHAPRYIPEEEYYHGYDPPPRDHHAPLRHHDHHAPLRHHPEHHTIPPPHGHGHHSDHFSRPPSHHGHGHHPDHFSGQQFLSHVGHIFDGAATGQLHPSEVGPIVGSTLLQDIQDKVHSELNIGPEGGRYTKLVVGETTPVPPAEPPPFLPGLGGFQPRVDITPKSKPVKKVVHKRHGHISRHDGYHSSSNDKPQKSKKVPKKPQKGRPRPEGQLSFSELMSDFLQKPLPFNAAQKSRHLDSKDPPYG